MHRRREDILNRLKKQIEVKGHMVAAASGSGLSAKYTIVGGADLIVALPSGFYRQMGRSSKSCYLPFANTNQLVMARGASELLPIVGEVPVLFGLCATDPHIQLDAYLDEIAENGFCGVINYPSISFLDGIYRESLEDMGINFEAEVEMISLARKKGLVTAAFVNTPEQCEKMIRAGGDIICVHFGLTRGGIMGAKKVLSLEAGAKRARSIFEICDRLAPGAIKLVFGGPIKLPIDVKYMYDNTSTMGFMGGSTFDRIPYEQTMIDTTKQFNYVGKTEQDKLISQMIDGIENYYNYVDFIKKYVELNYMKKVSFGDLSNVVHVSRPYLSSLFKKEVGCTFPEYLTRVRIGKAMEILKRSDTTLVYAAQMVGYSDYAHFSKSFKKLVGCSPRQWCDIRRKEQDVAPSGGEGEKPAPKPPQPR